MTYEQRTIAAYEASIIHLREENDTLLRQRDAMLSAMRFMVKELRQDPDHSLAKTPVYYALATALETLGEINASEAIKAALEQAGAA